MGYKKAQEVLPEDLIELIQMYVDGENIYIPRKDNQRKAWGEKTAIRHELEKRNRAIYVDYQKGYTVKRLSTRYYLSEKSIQRILRNMKKERTNQDTK